MTSADAPFIPVPFIERHLDIETRDDGVLIERDTTPLRPLEAHLPALFRRAAARNPDRTFLAKRPASTGPASAMPGRGAPSTARPRRCWR